MLRPTRGSNGYLTVSLFWDNVKHTRTVHKLVALAFLGTPPTPAHELNHLDGVRTNNRADNLAWVTSSENNRHRYDVLGTRAPRGVDHWRAKLTEDGVRDIRARAAAGESQQSIARRHGIAQQSVSDIIRGLYWGWLV